MDFDKKFSYGTEIVSVVWQTNRRIISNVLRYYNFKIIPNAVFFYFSKKNLNF